MIGAAGRDRSRPMATRVARVLEQPGRRSRAFHLAVGSSFVVVLGAVDYLTGPDLSLLIFYLLPVILVAWYGGRWGVFSVSLLAAVVWIIVHLIERLTPAHPLVHAWNTTLRLGLFLLVAYALAALKHALQREAALARTDALTGLANRRAFLEAATVEMVRARRYGHPFTLVSVDLDGFKAINDRFGHHVGDLLLRTVADTMQRQVRATDTVARLGGDEFAVLLPETAPEPAGTVLAKLRDHLRTAMDARRWPVTSSMGAVTFELPPDSLDDMLGLADRALYEAKRRGKDTIAHEVVRG